MFSLDLFTFKETNISLCYPFELFLQCGSFGHLLDMTAPPVATVIQQQEVLFGSLFGVWSISRPGSVIIGDGSSVTGLLCMRNAGDKEYTLSPALALPEQSPTRGGRKINSLGKSFCVSLGACG